MMKIMTTSIPLLLLMKKLNMNLILMSSIMLMIIVKINNKIMITNYFLMMDQLSMTMIMLTLISTTLIILSSNSFSKIIKMILSIFLMLLVTFSFHSSFYFYITFELILIPTILLITKSGKQPERLQAGIYMLMYTVLASLPLLISILILKNNNSFMMIYMSMIKIKFIMFITLAFLVKMPMFFTHLWLPKAHVEAPLEGSMILAAILLKLGGYGLLRILPTCLNKITNMNTWIISISLLGGTATSLNCIRQKDLKALIAYSSVAHMGLVLASMFTLNMMGNMGALFMMIAHGLASSALFLLVNDLYLKTHSRNIILFKGLISIIPNMTFWWFMFMSMNISAPPSINTTSEILIMASLIMWNNTTMIPLTLMAISTASFSLLMFININHNLNSMYMFNFSKQKIFLSLFIHMIPLIIMLMKMEMMNY